MGYHFKTNTTSEVVQNNYKCFLYIYILYHLLLLLSLQLIKINLITPYKTMKNVLLPRHLWPSVGLGYVITQEEILHVILLHTVTIFKPMKPTMSAGLMTLQILSPVVI